MLQLFEWPEQEAYEELRPLVLFGASVPERAKETGTPQRTLYRRVERFERDGMLSLFGADPAAERAKRRGLEPAMRRMIVDLKVEHPALNNYEIKNIVYVRTGRRLGDHTAARVLSEEVVPLKLSRLFEPYHEMGDGRERRGAVVTLHLDGWRAEATLLEAITKDGDLATREVLRHQLESMRIELAGHNASPLERLLTERVVVTWLEVQLFTGLLAIGLKNGPSTQDEFRQKRLDRAHRRHLSAVKTLAQIRKMGPAVQINIAEKQINNVNGGAL